MAEAKAPRTWTTNVLCRYYMHGVCKQGPTCNYSHDTGSKPAMACKFYLQGQCTYGDRCRYDHVRPKPAISHLPHSVPMVPSPGGTNKAFEKPFSNMVKLTKDGSKKAEKVPVSSPTGKEAEQWVRAAEFIPGQKWKGAGPVSYLAAAQAGVDTESDLTPKTDDGHNATAEATPSKGHELEMCPYAANGECRFGENCTYMHGERCDFCGNDVLHPTDRQLRDKHVKECVKNIEEDMELSFAVQRSKEKSCGICMEVVWEKNPATEQRFGILSNCCHIFCLSCIRKWRSAKQFENKIVRACPECRVKSDFVTPSKYWVEDKEEKSKLIQGYKQALSTKKCRYFDQGRGECPFNENCFYLHAYPDGRKASPKPVRRRQRQNGNGDLDLITQLILWDFLEERNSRLIDYSDMDDLIYHLNFIDSSDEDSEYSDFDLYPY